MTARNKSKTTKNIIRLLKAATSRSRPKKGENPKQQMKVRNTFRQQKPAISQKLVELYELENTR